MITLRLERCKCYADTVSYTHLDLGPEGGDGGGTVVFAGTPEDCANCAESATGEYLKKVLA